MTHRQTAPAPAPDARVPARTAAEYLRISIRTLDRYQAAGKITPTPTPLAPRMFRITDLARLRGDSA